MRNLNFLGLYSENDGIHHIYIKLFRYSLSEKIYGFLFLFITLLGLGNFNLYQKVIDENKTDDVSQLFNES